MAETTYSEKAGHPPTKSAVTWIRILLCDEDPVFLRKIRGMLEEYLQLHHIPAKIHALQTWSSLAERILNSCDMAFLDIPLPSSGLTGLDIAKKLRTVREDAVIIFITNHLTYAPVCFEVQAFRYLLKSEVDQKFDLYLQQALARLQCFRKTIKIKSRGEMVELPVSDILYLESQQHRVCIHLSGGSSRVCYGSLGSLEVSLCPLGFLRIHRSFLVNMQRILKLQCQEVVLEDGTALRVSERSYPELKAQYLTWKHRQG